MGLRMEERRAGTLVWVEKKNGTWWPGRVVDPTHLLRRPRGASPVQLLAAAATSSDTASLEWINLEKSEHIKTFRCEEFKKCIKKVESDLAQYPKGTIKYAHRENAIRHALQLEEGIRKKLKKRKARGEGEAEIVPQVKRSRSVYLPAETDCLSAQSILGKCGTSVKSTKSVSSKSSFIGPNTSQETKVSAVDTLMADLPSQFSKYSEKAKSKEAKQHTKSNGFSESHSCQKPKNKIAEKWAREEKIKRKQKISNIDSLEFVLNFESVSKTRNGDEYNGKSCYSSESVTIKHLALEEKIKRKQKKCNIVPKVLDAVINIKSFSDTIWIDVEVTMEARSGGNNVPLVSLMSKLNGKAIIGYPINIEKISDFGVIKHAKNEGIATELKVTCKKRRTPVCYASPSPSSLEEKNIKNAKNLKKCGSPVVSCVPVAKIFHGLLLAIGKV